MSRQGKFSRPLNPPDLVVEWFFIFIAAIIPVGLLAFIIFREPLITVIVLGLSLVIFGIVYYLVFYVKSLFDGVHQKTAGRYSSWREEQALIQREHQIAMERVNINPETSDFLLKDVGILAYTDEHSQPQLARRGKISSDVQFIRPFARIQARFGKENHTVELEIRGQQNQKLFSEICEHPLTSPVITSSWLSVKSIPTNDSWQLRIKVDGQWLAIHLMHWSKFRRSMARVRKDGEINQELSRLVANEGLASMSLNELLGNQED